MKDKAPLLKYRQLIERQMERFKVIERETKTKEWWCSSEVFWDFHDFFGIFRIFFEFFDTTM